MKHTVSFAGAALAALLLGAFFSACGASSSTGDGGGTCALTSTTAGGSGGQGGGALLGGQGGGTPDACVETSSTTSSEHLPADIIIAVDTSPSMAEGFPLGIGPSEIDEVRNNLNVAASIIVSSGIDVHVILIADANVCIAAPLGSGACPGDELLPAYRHVAAHVDSSQVFGAILGTYDQWSSALRPNATKTILVVTDDNDDMAPYGNANAFLEQLVAKDGSFATMKLDSIIAFEGPEICTGGCDNDPCCPCWPVSPITWPLSAADGAAYRTLTAWTDGVEGNLCLQDFDSFFVAIGNDVVEHTPISCVYEIPAPPEGQSLDPDKVNIVFVPDPGTPELIPGVVDAGSCGINGWYYDDPASPTHILLCPATCAAVRSLPSGEVQVKFGCATKFA